MSWLGILVALIAFGGCGGGEPSEAKSRPQPTADARAASGRDDGRRVARVVRKTIRPLMKDNDVPGMAVGLTVNGKRHFFSFGVASKASGRKVSKKTIFELGSVSKTFTATLGSYARERGALSLSDEASKHLPALAGSAFDRVSLLDLATYTAGGLPLQFPDDVTSEDAMIPYFRGWQPAYSVGTQRLYSNPSIGLFGHLAARSLGRPFDELMERRLFPMLGLTRTHIHVPQRRMGDYAWGYGADGAPIRVSPGVLDSEAYGVKSTAPDMVRFVEQNMGESTPDETLRRAIAGTHTGYDQVGGMTQGLGWEMYPYPTDLERLTAGNSPAMALQPNPVTPLEPPRPRRNVLINKTGSTNGFGAYVAFVPSERTGIVLLANRNYPIPARVRAAHGILTALDRTPAAGKR
jgi:beta-lactamase class C